jgi:caspase domain-containing protein
MRRALLIGIDNYPSAPLNGCVADAERMEALLKCHYDGEPNFDCRLLVAPRNGRPLERATLREALETHLTRDADVAFLHYSGHGLVNELGGFLVTSDGRRYDEGISMRDLMLLANESKIPEVTIILDCCHSGALGEVKLGAEQGVVLREGVALLTASGRSDAALETGAGGLFTALVCEALEGEAADIFGHVTVAGVYAHVDPHLGAWDQRPQFRAHLKRLTPLRRTEPPIARAVLRRLPELFANEEAEYALDPSYEPSSRLGNSQHETIFGELQTLRARGLIEPVAEKHMYDAAMRSGSCHLTKGGQRCWRLAKSGRI